MLERLPGELEQQPLLRIHARPLRAAKCRRTRHRSRSTSSMNPPNRVYMRPGASCSSEYQPSTSQRPFGISVIASRPRQSRSARPARSRTPPGARMLAPTMAIGSRALRLHFGQPRAQLADLEQRALDRGQFGRRGRTAHGDALRGNSLRVPPAAGPRLRPRSSRASRCRSRRPTRRIPFRLRGRQFQIERLHRYDVRASSDGIVEHQRRRQRLSDGSSQAHCAIRRPSVSRDRHP